jgi:imidazole glycerol-phosphate synthase subunit HisH
VLVVVDYGIGNLRSAVKALGAVGREARLVEDPAGIDQAAGIVLPGVGDFGRCAAALDERGWRQPLLDAISAGVPFLGICVGFQLLYESSEESSGAAGLGVFSGRVRRMDPGLRLPQIQWNRLALRRPSALLPAETSGQWAYFVHSYAAPIGPETTATCDYGGTVAAAIERGACFGVQFHPEKSGRGGLEILGRFARLAGSG